MSQKTIIINGRRYDAITGMPVNADNPASSQAPATPKRLHTPHSQLHTSTQKSHTLNRRVVKKMEPVTHTQHPVQKSPHITKFAPHPSGLHAHAVKTSNDIAAREHPLVAKAKEQHQARQHHAQHAPKPSHVIKEEAIQEALDKAPSKSEQREKRSRSKFSRFASVASATLALLLLGGYFTYLNMPSLSVRVAAAQAGVDASYPEYKPDGYRLSGPIAYTGGQVSMKFAANAGPHTYTIDQSKSSWDSSAVLDNYVMKKVGQNYLAYNERGLTIYTFGGNAAWVNGGILYTISGDAPLSSDQIRRIATSM